LGTLRFTCFFVSFRINEVCCITFVTDTSLAAQTVSGAFLTQTICLLITSPTSIANLKGFTFGTSNRTTDTALSILLTKRGFGTECYTQSISVFPCVFFTGEAYVVEAV
jgi:hypothetical protein